MSVFNFCLIFQLMSTTFMLLFYQIWLFYLYNIISLVAEDMDTEPVLTDDLPQRSAARNLTDRSTTRNLSERSAATDLSERSMAHDLSERSKAHDLSERLTANDLPERSPINDLPETSQRSDGGDIVLEVTYMEGKSEGD